MITYAIISLGVIGLIFGAGLALAYRKFAVEVDPMLEAVREALPGINCGACGYPGCSSLAEAIVKGEADITACTFGGAATARRLAQLLGRELVIEEKKVAKVYCQGSRDKCPEKFIYDGVMDCQAVMLVGGGNKACNYGCLGLGTCARVCPVNAITMGEDRLPIIDENRCTGCGICVRECPRQIIHLTPVSQRTYILCSSNDRGAAVRKICQVGCIGCGRCAKVCPVSAITMENFLAHIDYEKCTDCGKCVEVCPMKTIVQKDEVKPGVVQKIARAAS